jgi:type IV pilus assembly protein PilP
MNKLNFSLVTMVCFMVVGCDSRIDAVNQAMSDIRKQTPVTIEPAPEFSPVPTFSYSAQQLRSPFFPSSLADELTALSGRKVYPDLTREQQPLEHYSLDSLKFKGSIKGSTNSILALIQTPDREIERVQVGNYLGLNQGRIINITPTRIDLLEVVPDGGDGYVERPRSLILLGPTN